MTCWVAVRRAPSGPPTVKSWADRGRPRSKFSSKRLLKLSEIRELALRGDTAHDRGPSRGCTAGGGASGEKIAWGYAVDLAVGQGGELGSASLWRGQ